MYAFIYFLGLGVGHVLSSPPNSLCLLFYSFTVVQLVHYMKIPVCNKIVKCNTVFNLNINKI